MKTLWQKLWVEWESNLDVWIPKIFMFARKFSFVEMCTTTQAQIYNSPPKSRMDEELFSPSSTAGKSCRKRNLLTTRGLIVTNKRTTTIVGETGVWGKEMGLARAQPNEISCHLEE